MSYAVISALAAGVEILIFYILGRLIPIKAPGGGRSVAENICIGFIFDSAVLEIISLFMKWAGSSLTSFLYVWAFVISVLVSASLFLRKGRVARDVKKAASSPRLLMPELIVFITAAAASAYAAVFPSYGSGEATVGRISGDIASDTLGLYGTSGVRLFSIPSTDLLTGFYCRGTFISMLTGLTPEAVCNYVGVFLTVFLSVLAVYRVCVRLFSGKRRKAVILVIIWVGINLFFKTAGAADYMMFESGFTGDAMCLNVLLPILVIIAHEAATNPDDRAVYTALFLFGVCAPSWSPVSIYAAPFAMAAAMAAAALISKRAEVLGHLFLSLIIPASAFLLAAAVPMIKVA